MKFATVLQQSSRAAGAFASHLAHGALLAMGVMSIIGVAANAIEHKRIEVPLAAAMNAANAAEAVPTPAQQAQVDTHFDLAVAKMLESDPLADDVAGLTPELDRVRRYVAKRYRVSASALEAPMTRALVSGEQLGIDPLLIVAVMAIESSFNPMAESTVGAQGLMQVIPKFHMDKIGEDAGPNALFDPVTNVRVGSLVIKEGLRRYGSLTRALQYYGGALSDPEAGYARKVLSMKAKLEKIASSAA